MKSVKILIDSVNKVKDFVAIISKQDGDFDIVSERYVVDAKSIMGIYSLDIGKPIQLNIHNDENVEQVLESIKEFVVK